MVGPRPYRPAPANKRCKSPRPSTYSAAVLDYACGDDNQTAILCDHLVKRQVPFMFYTGYDEVDEAHRTVLLVRKPASSEVLLRALMQLLLPSRSHLKALSRRC